MAEVQCTICAFYCGTSYECGDCDVKWTQSGGAPVYLPDAGNYVPCTPITWNGVQWSFQMGHPNPPGPVKWSTYVKPGNQTQVTGLYALTSSPCPDAPSDLQIVAV
jgi:hypothetical protein